jgi:hypothetical protein
MIVALAAPRIPKPKDGIVAPMAPRTRFWDAIKQKSH